MGVARRRAPRSRAGGARTPLPPRLVRPASLAPSHSAQTGATPLPPHRHAVGSSSRSCGPERRHLAAVQRRPVQGARARRGSPRAAAPRQPAHPVTIVCRAAPCCEAGPTSKVITHGSVTACEGGAASRCLARHVTKGKKWHPPGPWTCPASHFSRQAMEALAYHDRPVQGAQQAPKQALCVCVCLCVLDGGGGHGCVLLSFTACTCLPAAHPACAARCSVALVLALIGRGYQCARRLMRHRHPHGRA